MLLHIFTIKSALYGAPGMRTSPSSVGQEFTRISSHPVPHHMSGKLCSWLLNAPAACTSSVPLDPSAQTILGTTTQGQTPQITLAISPTNISELIFDGNQKVSVMIETLLYVCGLCEPHSELTEENVNPFKTDTKGRVFVVDASINWPSNRNWQAKVLESFKVSQRIYFFRKVLRRPTSSSTDPIPTGI